MKRRKPLPGDGFSIVDTGSGTSAGSGKGLLGYRDAGMTTHRGALSPDDHEHF